MEYLLLLFINDQFIPPAKTLSFEQCRSERRELLFTYAQLRSEVIFFGKVVVFCKPED